MKEKAKEKFSLFLYNRELSDDDVDEHLEPSVFQMISFVNLNLLLVKPN